MDTDNLQNYERLITGYIRGIEEKCKLDIPSEIQKIILMFYPKIIDYVGIFKEENAGDCITILDDYKIDGFESAKLNVGLPVRSQNKHFNTIYRWRAIYNAERMPEFACPEAVIFGVVSNRCKDLDGYADLSLIDAYGISMKPGRVFNGRQTRWGYLSDDKYEAFNQNQIIEIKYQINKENKCKLFFYVKGEDDLDHNNKLLYEMNLPNNDEITAWYPVFSKANDPGFIQFLPFDL